jgi:hypothetical protein
MKIEKHRESLQEVLDEITAALDDPRGVISHQRRLAMMLSIGICDLFSIYFHKHLVMKSGSMIKHEWFRQKRLKELLQQQIIQPIEMFESVDLMIKIARDIEEARDNLAYGAPLKKEDFLIDKINQFLEMKKIAEKGGEGNEPV